MNPADRDVLLSAGINGYTLSLFKRNKAICYEKNGLHYPSYS